MTKGHTDVVTGYGFLALRKECPCVISLYLTTLSKLYSMHCTAWTGMSTVFAKLARMRNEVAVSCFRHLELDREFWAWLSVTPSPVSPQCTVGPVETADCRLSGM